MGIDRRLIEHAEERVSVALASGRPPDLEVLGYGEITTVIGLSDGARRYAAKRLPPFTDRAAVQRYAAVLARYMEILTSELGVAVPEQELVELEAPDGRVVVYMVQVGYPAGALAHRLLHTLPDDQSLALFERLLDVIARLVAVNGGGPLDVGLDAQLSNWIVGDAGPEAPTLPAAPRLIYLDLSTPLLREDGRVLLDTELFLSSLPTPLVPIVRRFLLDDLLARYHTPRTIVRDVIANLYKERRPDLVPAWVDTANRRGARDLPDLATRPLTVAEVEADYRADARMWAWLQRARRLDRFVLQRLLRRRYDFLLPGRIDR